MPGLPSFRLSPNPSISPVDLDSRVADFILSSPHRWNSVLLARHFDPLSMVKIMEIRLPPNSNADTVVWTPDFKGIFSVRSANGLIQSNHHYSLAPVPQIDWKKLWSLSMHERLKFLLWNMVPTRAQVALQLQGTHRGDVSCPFCDSAEETLHHLLLSCSYSRRLWRLAPWPLKVDSFQAGDILQWLSCIIDPSRLPGFPRVEYHRFQLFATILTDCL